jgi:hypothetical protein
MCTMVIDILRVDGGKNGDENNNSVMYEVRADQYMWAICGRSSGKFWVIRLYAKCVGMGRCIYHLICVLFLKGVVSMEGCENQQVSLDVMPMSAGFLPLPAVHLSKYIPAEQKSKKPYYCKYYYERIYILCVVEGGNSGSVPKLEPFNVGQVYNRGKGSQVHVLPPPQSVGGSTGGLSGGSGGGSSLPLNANDGHF